LYPERYNNDTSWQKIIHTRHPFERLYSGYKDKFNTTTVGWKLRFKDKASKLKPYESKFRRTKLFKDKKNGLPLEKNFIISFPSFLDYIANNPVDKTDIHFQPISCMCSACNVKFDFVSKQESLVGDMLNIFENVFDRGTEFDSTDPDSEDQKIFQKFKNLAEETIQEIHLGQKYAFPYLFPYKSHSSAKEVYKKIAATKHGRVILEQIYSKFRWDFELFGYSTSGYF